MLEDASGYDLILPPDEKRDRKLYPFPQLRRMIEVRSTWMSPVLYP